MSPVQGRKKVHIASSREREIGAQIKMNAIELLPEGWTLTDDMEVCEVFISVMYDKLLTSEYVATRRCFNFHPGLLPDYRGSGAYSWALLNKENRTGVTLHEIDYHIDSGRIIATKEIDIIENDTAEALFAKSMRLIESLFMTYFTKLLTCDYDVRGNEGGHLYLRRHLEEQKDISHIVRAFTFKGKESCYWIDSTGEKHYMEWK